MKIRQYTLATCSLLLTCCTGVSKDAAPPGSAHYEAADVMRGMYSYMADAPRFVDCSNASSMPVAMVADNLSLERAYMQERHKPGEAMLVVLEGRIEKMLPMEGPLPVDTLIPERFIGIQAGKDCNSRITEPVLLNTYWKLTYLGEARVESSPDQREPHLVLHDDGRVTGNNGCNLLNGAFRQENGYLSFFRIASTMMACPQREILHQEFNRILAAATRYRILDEYLELLDDDGAFLARFAAGQAK